MIFQTEEYTDFKKSMTEYDQKQKKDKKELDTFIKNFQKQNI